MLKNNAYISRHIQKVRSFAEFLKSPTCISLSNSTLTNPTKPVAGISDESIYKASPSSSISILCDHLKNGRVDEARALFNRIPSPNVFLSTKMISCYVENFRLKEALNLFDEIRVKDQVLWNLMIKGCVDCGELDMSLRLFGEMSNKNVISWTTVMNGLLKYGRVEEAERLFWSIAVRDTAAWNAMVTGYFRNGKVEEALRLFEIMPIRNVISWTAMIGGLNQCGRSAEALLMFVKMMDCRVRPTSHTFSCVITACANEGNLKLGIQVHGHIVKLGYICDAFVAASLVTFYANCRQMDGFLKAFNEKLYLNVVVWTSLLTGYGVNGKHKEAVKVFGDMFRIGVIPNQSSFTSALNSTCEIESVDCGKQIHGAAVKLGLDSDVYVGNSLVVLYSKCGNVCSSVSIFKEIAEKNIVSWNAIIAGCAQHGWGKPALALFSQMVRAGVDPDDITFTGLLTACSHSGMLQKGQQFFKYMPENRTVAVKLEHYACMVDVLCRSDKLDEAENLVKTMPIEPSLSIWLALLSGCRMHSNLEVAESAAESILNLDPNCSAAYVLMSNMYAFAGRWTDAAIIRRSMKAAGITKQPGCSWVTQKGVKHTFVSGDRSHPLSEKIYEKLDWLRVKLKQYGYAPDHSFALHDVEDEHKEAHLLHHSERLAICFALISTVEGSTITIMKNLRVCGDCHSAIKLIAKIVKREIVLRDSSRFHHFRDGFCSCGDYW